MVIQAPAARFCIKAAGLTVVGVAGAVSVASLDAPAPTSGKTGEYILEKEDGGYEYGYVKDGAQMVAVYDKDFVLSYDGPHVEETPPAPKNAAFVFIKPHAVTDASKALVKSEFAERGIEILAEGDITSEEIDAKLLIDQHYYAIASKATILKPAELNVPSDKFEAAFGMSWTDALATGRVLNAMDGCAELGVDADGLDKQWGAAKKAGKLVKFGGGFYCGQIDREGAEPLYIFNGFFMSMRSKFTAPGQSIHYYVVEFDSDKLSWGDFRGKVLGPTDPADAPADSLRGKVFSDWESLGLKYMPNVGDNGVHASASPFEALAERANWISADATTDDFGAALISAGVSPATIKEWGVDPQVKLPSGKQGSIFDALEDLDAQACIDKCVEIAGAQ